MKIIQRLSKYIEFKGISLNAFDISIGASNGYIGKQIKNTGSIGGDIIEKISEIYTDLSLIWLIKGEGEMIKGNINGNYSGNNIGVGNNNKVNVRINELEKENLISEMKSLRREIEILLKQISDKDLRIQEKESQLKEKDTQIRDLLHILKQK